MSSDLFSLYSQSVMNKLEELDSIKVRGLNINNTRYADDMVHIANTEEMLQSLVDRLDEECRGRGLKISINKTEVVGVTKRKEQLRVDVNIGGHGVKQVRSSE